MEVRDFLLKLAENIKDAESGVFKSICIWILIAGCIFGVPRSNYFIEKWQEPKWKFVVNEQGEQLFSDIELASGCITMCPQIVVKYKNKIIYIINVIDYYDKNYADLTYVVNGDQEVNNNQFFFGVSKENRYKLKEIEYNLSYLIYEQLEKNGFEGETDFEIYTIRLAKVVYQNKTANQKREMYIYISDDSSRRMLKREVRLRNSENRMELKKYDRNQSVYLDEMIIYHVKRCAAIINYINEV